VQEHRAIRKTRCAVSKKLLCGLAECEGKKTWALTAEMAEKGDGGSSVEKSASLLTAFVKLKKLKSRDRDGGPTQCIEGGGGSKNTREKGQASNSKWSGRKRGIGDNVVVSRGS